MKIKTNNEKTKKLRRRLGNKVDYEVALPIGLRWQLTLLNFI